MSSNGKVYLVGAGPGAADLITVRGAAILREAAVVIYDYLANPELLRLAPGDAELIYAGKKGGERSFDQSEINQLLIERARAGKCVVRLKGGDPFIFGRGGEEAEALAAAAIDFEIVPGVTSAIAAPAFAGIPLTHREHGSFVAFLTGHEDVGKDPETALPWNELARAARRRGTLVLLMATARMREHLNRLMNAGMSADTPAAAVQWATTAAQRTIAATLGTLADEVDRAALGAPAVVVIGECAALRPTLGWFEKLPLHGRRIVVTRAATNADVLSRKLRALGAEPVEFPTIETVAPDSYEALDQAIAKLAEFDWVIFTSVTGVDNFITRIRSTGHDLRELSRASLAAIGPATAARLGEHALRVAAMPAEYRAEAVIDAIGVAGINGACILIPRAQVAREILPQLLIEGGAREVMVAPAYKTVIPARNNADRIRELIAAGGLDLATFTSSSTVTNFHKLVGPAAARVKAAAIGPITADTARRLGFEVAVCPPAYTVDALVAAIIGYFAG